MNNFIKLALFIGGAYGLYYYYENYMKEGDDIEEEEEEIPTPGLDDGEKSILGIDQGRNEIIPSGFPDPQEGYKVTPLTLSAPNLLVGIELYQPNGELYTPLNQ